MLQARRSGSSKSLSAKLLSGERAVLVKPSSRKNWPSSLESSERELMP